MKAVNPKPDDVTSRAIAAESLAISPEEYVILAGEAFDGTADTTLLKDYFGCSTDQELEELSGIKKDDKGEVEYTGIRELLSRTGVAYTDLIELVKTQFINPYQNTLDYLEKLLTYAAQAAIARSATFTATDLYDRLQRIEAGTLDPGKDADIAERIRPWH